MDGVLVRKLRAPGNAELAIGSDDESGWVYLTEYAGQAGANFYAAGLFYTNFPQVTDVEIIVTLNYSILPTMD